MDTEILNLRTQADEDSKNFITLKEASEISGYAPDYIGQLIRSGKISGKQVYNSVSWLANADVLLDYANKNKKIEICSNAPQTFVARVCGWLVGDAGRRASRIALFVVAVFSACIVLALLYVFATSIDYRLQQQMFDEIIMPT